MESLNDRDLVCRAQKHDADAFASLYRARVRDVGKYVGTIVRRPEAAEELVAEVFYRVWRELPQLREPERFDAWLFKIAHSVAIDAVRQPVCEPIDEARHVADPSPAATPEPEAERDEASRLLRRVLLELPEDQREVIVMRFFLDCSHREVAARLGRSEQAVRAPQYRALGALRSRVEGTELRAVA